MPWTDIASIVWVCVTLNHLGLVSAVEGVIGKSLPIINCPRCATFWVTLVYCLCQSEAHTIQVLAISFAASYLALWVELAEAYIDTLYIKVYEQITKAGTGGKVTKSTKRGNKAGSVPKL